jgi:hypothetical protein
MGGFGSGHWYPDRKLQREDCWPIGADTLGRSGLLTPPMPPADFRDCLWTWRDGSRIGFRVVRPRGALRLILNFDRVRTDRETQREVREPLEQLVPVEAVKTTWGAVRWFFRCPTCDRRSGKLYLPCDRRRLPGFRCRICHDLTYRSRVASRQRPIPRHVWQRLSAFFGEPENPTYFRFYNGWGIRRRLR